MKYYFLCENSDIMNNCIVDSYEKGKFKPDPIYRRRIEKDVRYKYRGNEKDYRRKEEAKLTARNHKRKTESEKSQQQKSLQQQKTWGSF